MRTILVTLLAILAAAPASASGPSAMDYLASLGIKAFECTILAKAGGSGSEDLYSRKTVLAKSEADAVLEFLKGLHSGTELTVTKDKQLWIDEPGPRGFLVTSLKCR